MNRDLLVIARQGHETDAAMQHEIEVLNGILPEVEMISNVATATEILDLHRYRKITATQKVADLLQKDKSKAFVFIFNKN